MLTQVHRLDNLDFLLVCRTTPEGNFINTTKTTQADIVVIKPALPYAG